MSTLTSSPSPAASPRLQFSAHCNTSQRPTKSPRIPPFTSPGTRPRSTGAFAGTSPSPYPTRASTTKPRTADAGTQYSPEGLPPTASQTAGSKRKDPFASAPMSGINVTDQPSAPQAPPPPPEPQSDAQTAAPAKNVPSSATGLSTGFANVETTPAESPSKSKRPRTAGAHGKIMPLKYETCDAKDLGFLISNMLMELIRLNDNIPLNGRLTRFHSRYVPCCPYSNVFAC